MTVLHNLISTNRYYYLKYILYFKDDVMMIVTECVTERIGIIGRRGTTENYRLLWFILKYIINYFGPLKTILITINTQTQPKTDFSESCD